MIALLWSALAILLWVLGAALAVMLLIAATPLRLALIAETDPKPRMRATLRLLDGLAPPVTLHDSARPRRREAKEAAPRRKRAVLSRDALARGGRAAAAAPRLVVDLLRPFQLTRLCLDADIGLDDPADTGALYGAVAALRGAPPAGPPVCIDLRPDFDGPRLSARLDAEVRVTPAALAPPAMRFVWRVYGWM